MATLGIMGILTAMWGPKKSTLKAGIIKFGRFGSFGRGGMNPELDSGAARGESVVNI